MNSYIRYYRVVRAGDLQRADDELRSRWVQSLGEKDVHAINPFALQSTLGLMGLDALQTTILVLWLKSGEDGVHGSVIAPPSSLTATTAMRALYKSLNRPQTPPSGL